VEPDQEATPSEETTRARPAASRSRGFAPSLARARVQHKPGLSPAGAPLRVAKAPAAKEEPSAEEPSAEAAAIAEPAPVEPAPEATPAPVGKTPAPVRSGRARRPAARRPTPAVEASTAPALPEPDLGAAASAAADAIAVPLGAIETDLAVSVTRLTKRFGSTVAVDAIDLEVPVGSMFGFVGPNGAGKTTTLAMVTGMLRPDEGIIRLGGADVWRNPVVAKRLLGVLPDRLRLFDRLTGAEFLYHAGGLRGLDRPTIRQRSADLATAFGFEHSLDRLVSDYSAGMTKKISIAAAMIHAPRILVLDEPFESVDPVSAAAIVAVLERFTRAGGTVILSSHNMGLVETVCDSVAIIADGRVLAAGPLATVVAGSTLEKRFVELAGGATSVESMEWLHTFSD